MKHKNAAKRSRQHARIQRRGGCTHNIPQQTDTHIFIEGGGTHPQCNPTNGHTYFHKGGGRTHNVTQRTDTHIFTGGGRTHNVTQRTDTQIFFDKRN